MKNNPKQMDLLADSEQVEADLKFEEAKNNEPVTCLGITFPNDEDRRKHFTELLRMKLKDPEFRKIEGFPVGKDEDILALSDPPYYTACPNPWISDFITEWEAAKPAKPEGYQYQREPYAADVSEGKNDPIYNAHSYHTKVPHKAIMRYILHYTNPGDIVFDGFCGTGMTGVAASFCAEERAALEMDFSVKSGKLIDKQGNAFSTLGHRNAILSDLSPAATFIATNYGDLGNWQDYAIEALQAVNNLERSIDWLYTHKNNGKIVSAVWTDVFICPNCTVEFAFWDAAVDNGQMKKAFPCPNCSAIVGKSISKTDNSAKLDRAFTNHFDPILKKTTRIPKLSLVYQIVKKGGERHNVKASKEEQDRLISEIYEQEWSSIPTAQFVSGRQTNKLINGSGISYICHMYTPRALFAYGKLWGLSLSTDKSTQFLRYCLSGINNYISRKQGYFGGGGGVSGTLFTPSIHLERNVFDVLRRKINKLSKEKYKEVNNRNIAVTTQSIANIHNLPSNAIDYIFTDPPFGESLQYCELNSFIEAWLRVLTSGQNDCVLNYVHGKDLHFYSQMMGKAFSEYQRVLKPGRWITIEFHNSQNAVWNCIQQAIEAAGLVVADVRILNKQQRSFNAVNRSGAVDQDLVISAYKPNGGLEERFKDEAGTETAVWDFVRTHLKHLPIFVSNDQICEPIVERQSHLLFDRMVAFYVQRGFPVPISASEFYSGVQQRFSEREGMFFLPEQVAEYDKKRSMVNEIKQLSFLINDEESSIQWIRHALLEKPSTFQELNPRFIKEINSWNKNETPLELLTILEQNFLCYIGSGEVPNQIHSHLSSNWKDCRNLDKTNPLLIEKAKDRWYVPDPNKAGDIEKLREKSLLREFDVYKEATKKLKVFRLEAVRAGFKKAWQDRDYSTIISVAEKVPNDVLEEDPKLLMWYDQAVTRKGDV